MSQTAGAHACLFAHLHLHVFDRHPALLFVRTDLDDIASLLLQSNKVPVRPRLFLVCKCQRHANLQDDALLEAVSGLRELQLGATSKGPLQEQLSGDDDDWEAL